MIAQEDAFRGHFESLSLGSGALRVYDFGNEVTSIESAAKPC